MPLEIDNKQIIGLQRAEFAHAARIQDWILLIQIAIAVVASFTVFITAPLLTYFAAIGLVALAILWALLTWKFLESRAQAEHARRATLLMEGLGEKISQSALLELEASFSVGKEAGSKHEDKNYYSVVTPAGDERLAEMLEETTFWSSNLMRYNARSAWLIFIIYFASAIAILMLSIPFLQHGQLMDGLRVFCAVVTLLMSTDVLGAARAYDSAARSLSALLSRFEAVKARGYPRADLLLMLFDYNSAVESAPIISDRIYRRHKARLTELWAQRRP